MSQNTLSDEKYMSLALGEAKKAASLGEVPVGAVIVRNGEVIASSGNRREMSRDATAHAEVLCIRQACERLGGWHLDGCTLYVTMEPCPMCAGAIINSRVGRVVFGCRDFRAGSLGSVVDLSRYPYNHKPEILGGVLAEQALGLLREFFAERR